MKNKLKHLFIPHEGNGYKPHFLERFSMGIMFLMVFCTFALANLQSLMWISSDWLVSTILPAVIVELTNDERVDDRLTSLSRSSALDQAAQLKAEHMAENGYFAHHSPDGISPWYWFNEVDYNYLHAGENLAVHFTDSQKVVRGWMNSPTHRANIMSGDYTEIGVGTARGEYKGAPTIFVVQLFGTPKKAQQSAQIAQTQEPKKVLVQAELAQNEEPEEIAQAEREESDSFVLDASRETLEDVAGETVPSNTPVLEEDVVLTEGTDQEPRVIESLITTSTPGVPATASPSDTTVGQLGGSTIGFVSKTATQPHVWMQMLYAVLALMVVGALALSLLVEWRRQNPIQIAYATSLLLLMGVLLRAHTLLTSGVIIV